MYYTTGMTLVGHRNFSSYVWCSGPCCWLLYSLKPHSWLAVVVECTIIFIKREIRGFFYVLRLRRISYLTIFLFLWFFFECIKGCSYGFIPVPLLSSFFCFGNHTPHSVHTHNVELARRVRSHPFRFSQGHNQIVFSSLSLVFLGRVKVRDSNNGESTLYFLKFLLPWVQCLPASLKSTNDHFLACSNNFIEGIYSKTKELWQLLTIFLHLCIDVTVLWSNVCLFVAMLLFHDDF